MIPTLRFGPVKSKQKPLKIDSKGELTTVFIAGFVRKMSDETQQVFDSLFGGQQNAFKKNLQMRKL